VHAGLDSSTDPGARVLTASPDWLQISADAPVHTDVERFEAISREAELVDATSLDAALADRLREAVELYRGDLLENWYQGLVPVRTRAAAEPVPRPARHAQEGLDT
jgi:hypothetical protein